jgi:AcrR family transcriptional regulator
MKSKKDKIIDAALELFANEGFSATSTNRIAKKAGVSEGLIFRHFNNKNGLLQAILKKGEKKIKTDFADIVLETNPREVIRKAIDLGPKMVENEGDARFWKLQYKIKWEIEQYNEHKTEPLERALTHAFKELGYETPELEAKFLLINLDGLATRYFLQENFDLKSIHSFWRKKYKQ